MVGGWAPPLEPLALALMFSISRWCLAATGRQHMDGPHCATATSVGVSPPALSLSAGMAALCAPSALILLAPGWKR